jgi:hypothetical protein
VEGGASRLWGSPRPVRHVMELEGTPITGNVREREIKWITFETDNFGRLIVRSLNGFKVIEDPRQAREIIRALRVLADI